MDLIIPTVQAEVVLHDLYPTLTNSDSLWFKSVRE